MKEYVKPEVEVVEFSSEVIADMTNTSGVGGGRLD